MSRYISTYQKDFGWPYVKTMAIRDKPAHPTVSPGQGTCTCDMDPKIVKLPKEFHIALGDVSEWSRIGPMGPLLDPKLYPAKTGPSPESEITKTGQPNIYLKKLEEKYPYLYGILQSASPDEMVRKVDADRLKTTYQLDYTEKAAGTTQRDDLLVAAKMEGPHLQACVTKDVRSIECQRNIRPLLTKEGRDKKKHGALDVSCGSGKYRRKKGEELNPKETRPPPWKSEYEDNISRTGAAIIRSKMHDPKKKEVPLWAISF